MTAIPRTAMHALLRMYVKGHGDAEATTIKIDINELYHYSFDYVLL